MVEAIAERVGIPWKLRCAILAVIAMVIAIAVIEKAMHGAGLLELLVPMFSLAKSILNMLRYSDS